MLQCRLWPHDGIRALLAALQNERSAILRKRSHADIRNPFMSISFDLRQSSAYNCPSVALDHAIPLAHQFHQSICVSVQRVSAHQNARPGSVTEQIEGDTTFFHFRRDPCHLN